MTKAKILIVLAVMLGVCNIYAQRSLADEFSWANGNEDTFEERITPTNPPTGDVRAVAEFEPMEAVIVRYPLGIPAAFVAELAEEIPVICLVNSNYQQGQAQSAFDAVSINNDNLSFMLVDTDSYWTRDYTAWFIIDGNHELGALNFEYNRPRPNDNAMPQDFAQDYDLNYFAMNIEQTGGNFMTDGYGVGAASHIAYTENNNNATLVDNTMLDYMGITNYMVIQDPNDTYIDHIDCWGKFLSVDKVLIRDVASSHSQYDELNDVADMFATTDCSWGYPYEVVRVYTPNDQPYTNSLILNDRVFVPQTGSQWDDDAMETYENAMPGYEIIGVFNNTGNPWESTDALHCRTHEVPDNEMLSILHFPLFGVLETSEFTITAEIVALSGETIYTDSTMVYYRPSTEEEWQSELMTAGENNQFTAVIGPFSDGANIQYYIHSAAENGNSEDYPYIGAADPFDFLVSNAGDTTPPVIEFTEITEIDQLHLPITVTCNVSDNVEVESVVLKYRFSTEEAIIEDFELVDDSYQLTWFFENPEHNTSIQYLIEATDTSNNVSATEWITASVIPLSNGDNDVNSANTILGIYPNPFRDSVNIKYTSTRDSGKIKIYNIKGQVVKEFGAKQFQKGSSTLQWDGLDQNGNKVASGIYYIAMINSETKTVRKVIMVK